MMQQLDLWSSAKTSAIAEERVEDSVLAVGLGMSDAFGLGMSGMH